MAQHYCKKCGKTMDVKEFYVSKNIEKYPPDGHLDTCKKCLTMHVDNWDPSTYTWILEEIDVPYIKEEWDSLIEKFCGDPAKVTGLTILGRYLSKMKLKQWNQYKWADTERLAAENLERKVLQMRAQGLDEEEIGAQLAIDRTPPKPKGIAATPAPQSLYTEEEWSQNLAEEEEESELAQQLSEEEKTMLTIKWGNGYKISEQLRMEQLYRDMMESYDIQGAGHKDTLIMICKASLKANQLIDAGDIDSFQKMSKVYDALMKSGKFQAVQNKEENGEYVDSIGELVAICERDGFIPRYYIDTPNDKVDRVIQDMQEYTHDLVTEELGLANLIENSIKSLERERESIKSAAENSEDFEAELEEELFSTEKTQIFDSDFIDFFDDEEESENE